MHGAIALLDTQRCKVSEDLVRGGVGTDTVLVSDEVTIVQRYVLLLLWLTLFFLPFFLRLWQV